MKDFLKVGDVIELKKGMKVYAEVPSHFIFENRHLSNRLTSHDVEIGNVFDNTHTLDAQTDRLINKIMGRIHEEFASEELKIVDSAKLANHVRENIPKQSITKLTIPEGEYVVVNTELDGGGRSHNDVYPDGHRVYCKKLLFDGRYDDKGFEVNFYQSGSFTAMIEPVDLEVVRKLSMSVSFK